MRFFLIPPLLFLFYSFTYTNYEQYKFNEIQYESESLSPYIEKFNNHFCYEQKNKLHQQERLYLFMMYLKKCAPIGNDEYQSEYGTGEEDSIQCADGVYAYNGHEINIEDYKDKLNIKDLFDIENYCHFKRDYPNFLRAFKDCFIKIGEYMICDHKEYEFIRSNTGFDVNEYYFQFDYERTHN
jgi:hypothetical protein